MKELGHAKTPSGDTQRIIAATADRVQLECGVWVAKEVSG